MHIRALFLNTKYTADEREIGRLGCFLASWYRRRKKGEIQDRFVSIIGRSKFKLFICQFIRCINMLLFLLSQLCICFWYVSYFHFVHILKIVSLLFTLRFMWSYNHHYELPAFDRCYQSLQPSTTVRNHWQSLSLSATTLTTIFANNLHHATNTILPPLQATSIITSESYHQWRSQNFY